MLEPSSLHGLALALLLAAVGHAWGARVPPAGPWPVVGVALLALALLRAGWSVAAWPLAFAAAFLVGVQTGQPAQGASRRDRLRGAAVGGGVALAALLVAVAYRWWFAPAALVLALVAGLARQAWLLAQDARRARRDA